MNNQALQAEIEAQPFDTTLRHLVRDLNFMCRAVEWHFDNQNLALVDPVVLEDAMNVFVAYVRDQTNIIAILRDFFLNDVSCVSPRALREIEALRRDAPVQGRD